MNLEETEEFARAWLDAWNSRDASRVAAFYAEDCLFIDPTTPNGIRGRVALAAHCEAQFAEHPGNVLAADKVWQVEGGYFIRWYATLPGGKRVRGLELVMLDGELIVYNEGYFHVL